MSPHASARSVEILQEQRQGLASPNPQTSLTVKDGEAKEAASCFNAIVGHRATLDAQCRQGYRCKDLPPVAAPHLWRLRSDLVRISHDPVHAQLRSDLGAPQSRAFCEALRKPTLGTFRREHRPSRERGPRQMVRNFTKELQRCSNLRARKRHRRTCGGAHHSGVRKQSHRRRRRNLFGWIRNG